jgi:hypothetical protein
MSLLARQFGAVVARGVHHMRNRENNQENPNSLSLRGSPSE